MSMVHGIKAGSLLLCRMVANAYEEAPIIMSPHVIIT